MKTYEEYIKLVNDPSTDTTDRMLLNGEIYIESIISALDRTMDFIDDIENIYQKSIDDDIYDEETLDNGVDDLIIKQGKKKAKVSRKETRKISKKTSSIEIGDTKQLYGDEKKAIKKGYVTSRANQRTTDDVHKASNADLVNVRTGNDAKDEEAPELQEDTGLFKSIAATIASIIDKILSVFRSKKVKEDTVKVGHRAKRLSELVEKAEIGSNTITVPDDSIVINKYNETIKEAIKLIEKNKKHNYNVHFRLVVSAKEWSHSLHKDISALCDIIDGMTARYTSPRWNFDKDYKSSYDSARYGKKIAQGILEKNVNITINEALDDLIAEKTITLVDNVSKNLVAMKNDLVNPEVIKSFASMDFTVRGIGGKRVARSGMKGAANFSALCARLCNSYYRMIYARNKYYLALITKTLTKAGISVGSVTVIENVQVDSQMYDRAAKNFSDYVTESVRSYENRYDDIDDIFSESSGIIGNAVNTIKKIIRALIEYVTQMRVKVTAYVAGVRYRSLMAKMNSVIGQYPDIMNKKIDVPDYDKLINDLTKAQEMLAIRVDAFKTLNENYGQILDSNYTEDRAALSRLERELNDIKNGTGKYAAPHPMIKNGVAIATATSVLTVGAAYALLQARSRVLDKEMVEVMQYAKGLDAKLDYGVGIPRRSSSCAISLAEEGAMLTAAKSRCLIARVQDMLFKVLGLIGGNGSVLDNSDALAVAGAKFESFGLSKAENRLFANAYEDAYNEAVKMIQEEYDDDESETPHMDGEMDSDSEPVPGDDEADAALDDMEDSLSQEYVDDEDTDYDYDPMKYLF